MRRGGVLGPAVAGPNSALACEHDFGNASDGIMGYAGESVKRRGLTRGFVKRSKH